MNTIVPAASKQQFVGFSSKLVQEPTAGNSTMEACKKLTKWNLATNSPSLLMQKVGENFMKEHISNLHSGLIKKQIQEGINSAIVQGTEASILYSIPIYGFNECVHGRSVPLGELKDTGVALQMRGNTQADVQRI